MDTIWEKEGEMPRFDKLDGILEPLKQQKCTFPCPIPAPMPLREIPLHRLSLAENSPEHCSGELLFMQGSAILMKI